MIRSQPTCPGSLAATPPTGPASPNLLTPTSCVIASPRIYSKPGADLRTIQMLLGHRDLEQTAVYLHLSARHFSAVASPLDSLELSSSRQQDPGRS